MIILVIQMVNNDRPVQSVFKFYNTNTNHEHMGSSVAQWLVGWTTVRVIQDRSCLRLSLRLASSSR